MFCVEVHTSKGFPGGSDSKESTWHAGDLGLIPGLERSPGEGHGKPLQYSCLENSYGQRSLHPWGRKDSYMTERLSRAQGKRLQSRQQRGSACMLRSFPDGSASKETTCQSRRHRRCRFNPWVRKVPWDGKGNGNPL